ncbi:MAG: hypothetical protein FJ042_04510 [Candidatus Cloacimonetes bacterium]|nr:hypothetical protein [Candidatus Cloacimonadota bacterium]
MGSNNRHLCLNAITGIAMALEVRSRYHPDGIIWFHESDGSFTPITIQESSRLTTINRFDFSFVYGGSVKWHKLPLPLTLE